MFELSPEPGGGCPSGSNSGNGWCETVLYSFMSTPDGAFPFSGLTWDPYGNLYGTTYGGGSGMGTAYELSPNGSGGARRRLRGWHCVRTKPPTARRVPKWQLYR